VFGELGWHPNFNVKKSKNNDDRHSNFKEFFDAPKDYNVEFTNASKTGQEFFKGDTLNESMSQMRSQSPSIHND